jgi:hypothetical protein
MYVVVKEKLDRFSLITDLQLPVLAHNVFFFCRVVVYWYWLMSVGLQKNKVILIAPHPVVNC